MKLESNYRENTGKGHSRRLRTQGWIPGIVYGKENLPIKLTEKDTNKLIKSLAGATALIDLTINKDQQVSTKSVIIQDYQKELCKDRIEHVDFLEVDSDTELQVEVPIKTVGDSEAIKLGGVLQIIRHDIPVKCKATHIPEVIEVDISSIKLGESIHVLDIPYPEGVIPVVKGRNFTLMTLPSSRGMDAQVAEGTPEEPEESA